MSGKNAEGRNVGLSAGLDDWRSMDTAPRNTTDVRVRMADGTEHARAHWACDMSGEEQPPYRGWFVPVLRHDGRVSFFSGIDEPAQWRPILSSNAEVEPLKVPGEKP
ncbi:MAG: hypothetical protein ACT4QA_15670 [Panacagrimonas sp.]